MDTLDEIPAHSRVLAAMSGGVDSSVMASLLVEKALDVTGITMHLFGNELLREGGESTCCSADDVEDARSVCRALGIPHFTFNFSELFRETVVDRFCLGYLDGETPNPCIDCNRHLKFAALQRRRRELGCDYVATGHYARRRFNDKTGRWELLRAIDPAKDQSYVLFHLTQDFLAHMLFPLGELTKEEVRERARERGFATAEKPESQDICFIPDGDYAAFIERRAQTGKLAGASLAALGPGPIEDGRGNILGTHRGIARYTAGQRKGLGIAAAKPLYVCRKVAEGNRLVVGPAEEAITTRVAVRDVNLIALDSLEGPLACTMKTHYRQTPAAALIIPGENGTVHGIFDEPQRVCAPGQAAVFYDGERVLGGGTIDRCL